jgi:hypothetical protein
MSNDTDTLTLTDFLLARIAEDELDANDYHETGAGECDLVFHGRVDPNFGWKCTCGRPARVLAECEAKRRIVELHRQSWPVSLKILRILAVVYADHPDYRDEWA